MLKFTLNKNKLEEQYQNIDIKNMYYVNDKIVIETKYEHGLSDGEELYLRRNNNIGDTLFFLQTNVNILDEKKIAIQSLPNEYIKITKCEPIEVFSPLNDGKFLKLLKLTIDNTNLFTKKNIIFKNVYSHREYHNIICPDDYVLYNDIFILKCKTNYNGINYDGNVYNTKEKLFFNFKNSLVYIDIFLGLNFGGTDRQDILYWAYNEDEEEKVDFLIKNFNNTLFYFNDTRFFKIENDKLFLRKDFEGNQDTKIYKIKNELNFNLNVCENFDITLLKNDYYKNFYIEEKINENINKNVDMEKQIFIPKLENTSGDCVLNEINFKINVRRRENWFDSSAAQNEWYGTGSDSTSIIDIGFSEEDIKYQKTALKKSFLRLSFYDTPHRGNQKLLYYSTIFLDTNKLYNNYIYGDKKCDLEFSIKNCFNQFSSSEGYYLYLFPKFAKKDVPTTIYMKIDFNHAKYGVTIPLILPSDDQYKIGYIGGNDSYNSGLEKLFNDLYIKIKIMYDSKINKYTWCIPDPLNDKLKINNYINQTINMTLFEPIVNIVE